MKVDLPWCGDLCRQVRGVSRPQTWFRRCAGLFVQSQSETEPAEEQRQGRDGGGSSERHQGRPGLLPVHGQVQWEVERPGGLVLTDVLQNNHHKQLSLQPLCGPDQSLGQDPCLRSGSVSWFSCLLHRPSWDMSLMRRRWFVQNPLRAETSRHQEGVPEAVGGESCTLLTLHSSDCWSSMDSSSFHCRSQTRPEWLRPPRTRSPSSTNLWRSVAWSKRPLQAHWLQSKTNVLPCLVTFSRQNADVESFHCKLTALNSTSLEKLRHILDHRCIVGGGEQIFLLSLGVSQRDFYLPEDGWIVWEGLVFFFCRNLRFTCGMERCRCAGGNWRTSSWSCPETRCSVWRWCRSWRARSEVKDAFHTCCNKRGLLNEYQFDTNQLMQLTWSSGQSAAQNQRSPRDGRTDPKRHWCTGQTLQPKVERRHYAVNVPPLLVASVEVSFYLKPPTAEYRWRRSLWKRWPNPADQTWTPSGDVTEADSSFYGRDVTSLFMCVVTKQSQRSVQVGRNGENLPQVWVALVYHHCSVVVCLF